MDHEHAERHIWPVAATRETGEVEGASRTIRPQPWIEAIISSRNFPVGASLVAHAVVLVAFTFLTSGPQPPRDDPDDYTLSISLEAPDFESSYITMEEPLIVEEPGPLFPTLTSDEEEEPVAGLDEMLPQTVENPPEIDSLLQSFPGAVDVSERESTAETAASAGDAAEADDAAVQDNREERDVGAQVCWDTPASPLSGENRPPRYPPEAVRKGIEGRILLQLEVLADGTVGEVRVVESSGSDLLDEEAIRKVRTWRFAPARCGGRPMVSRVLVPIRFELR